MKRLISANVAGKILIILLSLLLIFHVLVLFHLIPFQIIWGGQLENAPENLMLLEIVALAVTVLFIIIVLQKMRLMKIGESRRIINIGIWAIFAYMILNTAGNIASSIELETMIFAPLTLLLAFFALRLRIEK